MAIWSTQDIPDLSGKLALVTGGNSGIGYWTALHLARAGAHVVLGCRSMPRAETAVAELRALASSSRIEILQVDLSDLKSVRNAALRFQAVHSRLDILCNNAGVAVIPKRVTVDGFESQFASNFLGHFALTGLLIDTVRATPGARVVHVCSFAHLFGRVDFDDLHFERRPYSPFKAYAQSKLANVLFMMELQRRFQRVGIDAISVGAHPGASGTNIFNHQLGSRRGAKRVIAEWVNRNVINSPEQAAAPSLLAATQPGIQGGRYFGPSQLFGIKGPPTQARMASRGRSESDAAQLWKLSEQLAHTRFPS